MGNNKFRDNLEERIEWRKKIIANKNKLGIPPSDRITYELSILEDLLITYDKCEGENPNKESVLNIPLVGVSEAELKSFDLDDEVLVFKKVIAKVISLHENNWIECEDNQGFSFLAKPQDMKHIKDFN